MIKFEQAVALDNSWFWVSITNYEYVTQKICQEYSNDEQYVNVIQSGMLVGHAVVLRIDYWMDN